MRKILKIDSNGYWIEDIILDDTEPTPSDCIETECSNGLYKPKWNGTKWIEGLTPEDIEIIKNTPSKPSLEEQNRADIDYISIMLGVDL